VRLLFVVQRFGREALGGAERHCREFAIRLAGRGHDVEVITSCAISYVDWANEYPAGTEIADGVRVHRLPVRVPRDDRFFGPLHRRVVGSRRPVAHHVQREWMRMLGPDLPDLPAWLRGHAGDFDAVIFFTYLYASSYDGLHAVAGLAPTVLHPLAHDEPALRLGLFDPMFHLVDAFGYNTEEEQTLVEGRFGVFRPSIVIGMGVDLDSVDSESHDVAGFRARFGLGDTPYLLYVGRVDPGKGSGELAAMFGAYTSRHAEPVALVVLGDPVSELPTEAGAVLTGAVDEETKETALAGCLGLAQPSYYESLSIVLIEAWAHQRPALVQGHCEVLVGQARRSGGAIPYRGFAEFEGALEMLVESAELAASLGAAGRTYVESRYRWDDLLVRYEDFVENVVATWRRQSGPDRRRRALAL